MTISNMLPRRRSVRAYRAERLDNATMSLVDTLRRKDWDAHRITIKYLWKD